MSNRREEAIVIEDSDSETECPAAAAAAAEAPKRKGPVTRSQAKKARAETRPLSNAEAQAEKARAETHPLSNAEAQRLLDSAIRASGLCTACTCRDKAHTAMDQLVGCFTSVPEFATVYSGGDAGEEGEEVSLQVSPPPIGWDTEHSDRAEEVARAIIGECNDIQHLIGPAARGLVIPRHAFADTARECQSLLQRRADSIRTTPGSVRRAIADTLAQVPDVLVDIVFSYIDVVQDVINPQFTRTVYGAYYSTIRQFVELQQAELDSLETSHQARRSHFDARRRTALQTTHVVIACARTLKWNHVNGNLMSGMDNTLSDAWLELGDVRQCSHSVQLAKTVRAEFSQRLAAISAEESRLQALGFSVAARLR